MKKYYSLIILFIVALIIVLFVQYDKKVTTDANKPKVAATIYPIYDLAQTIAGDKTNVVLLLPPGMSPHVYDPSPSIIQEAQKSDIVFAVGHGIDNWADNIIAQIPNTQKITVDIRVPLKKSIAAHTHEEEGNDSHEHEEENGYDPHYWLDPTNALIIIDTITNYIAANDPENMAYYGERAEELKKDIREHDATWKQLLETSNVKNIITFHDAFYYFASHFNIEVLTTFEPFPGKEPTAQYLAHVIEEVQEHNIDTLFLEPQLSASALETFAKDNNLTLKTLDPLGGVSGRDRYIDIIDYNVRTIAGQ